MSLSNRSLARGVAVAAVGAALALIGHFAVSPPPQSFVSTSALAAYAGNHSALLTSAWLDGIGSILLIVAVLGVVELASAAGTLAGRIVLLGGAAVVAHSLLADTLLIAAAQIAAAGNGPTAAAVVQILHAADYAFPIVNLFWTTALGLIVLRSRVLARGFGYVALAFAAVELVGGLAALYSDAVQSVVDPFFLVMVLWAVVAGITCAMRRAPRADHAELTSSPAT